MSKILYKSEAVTSVMYNRQTVYTTYYIKLRE
jgi:hypothetical protein